MMHGVTIRPVEEQDRAWIREEIASRWAADFVVAHGVTCFPHELSGVIAQVDDGTKVGLATYLIDGQGCELITIDSFDEKRWIGSMLLEAVVGKAIASNCTRIWLVTTNDNTNALTFYQKRGFVLTGC